MLAVAGGLLAACGSGPASAYKASTDCSVSSGNTDYNGCDFAHHNLSGDDLQKDSFENANLNGANLTGADLQGADLKGATYAGVVTTKTTICVDAQFGPCNQPGLRARKKIQYG